MAAFAVFFALAGTVETAAATLTIVVADMRNESGEVSINVFNEAGQWPAGTPVAKRKVTPAAGTATFKIKNLPPGTYAISGYHDENGNGKHDKTLVGYPLEGFVFSKDVKPVAAAPEFEAAAFALGNEGQKVTLHVQYWSEKKD